MINQIKSYIFRREPPPWGLIVICLVLLFYGLLYYESDKNYGMIEVTLDEEYLNKTLWYNKYTITGKDLTISYSGSDAPLETLDKIGYMEIEVTEHNIYEYRKL